MKTDLQKHHRSVYICYFFFYDFPSFNTNDQTGTTSGAGPTFPLGHLSLSPVFKGIRVVHLVQLYVFMFLAPCCDVSYDFRVKLKTMF